MAPISQTLENLLYNEELRYITKERFLDIVDNIVQDMDDEQNVIPDATLPLEFDAILPANTEKSESFKNEEVLKEEALRESEVLKESENEIIQKENTGEFLTETPGNIEVDNSAEVFKRKEIIDEPEVLKEEEIPVEEVFKSDEVDSFLNENSEKNSTKEEIIDEPEIVEDEVLKEESSANSEEVLKEEEEPHDSFLEDIHRFKNSESVIGFDGSLSEEIIEQTILQDNVDSAEISETEKHKQELAEKTAEVKLPSISQFIDTKHIEKFTKKLFKRDNVEYVRFLHELENIPQWKEAARHIDRHLAQNGIEPDSSVAEEFRELVHKRYGK